MHGFGRVFTSIIPKLNQIYHFDKKLVSDKMDMFLQKNNEKNEEGIVWTLYGFLKNEIFSKNQVVDWLQKFNFGKYFILFLSFQYFYYLI